MPDDEAMKSITATLRRKAVHDEDNHIAGTLGFVKRYFQGEATYHETRTSLIEYLGVKGK